MEKANTETVCGINCGDCGWKDSCGGCAATGGKPFGGTCMIAVCCQEKGCESCGSCWENSCALKKEIIAEYNALGIADMEEVTELYALKGSFVNLEYTLPSGQKMKIWDDDRMYLGNQLCKQGSDRCYGLTADENYLLVCEYGDNGADPELVVFKRRK